MQTVSFRIWTRVAVSISYDDNYYTVAHQQILTLYHILPIMEVPVV